MIKIARKTEKIIIYSLIIMMGTVLVLSTIELGYFLVKSIFSSDYLLLDLDSLMDLFGVFLLVLIGIELLDTIKIYLKENVVHVEVVVLVAIIALARKVVVLKLEEWDGAMIAGLGALIISLAVTYYLIKRAGLFVCDMGWDDEKNNAPKESSEDKNKKDKDDDVVIHCCNDVTNNKK
jgi:uncharacterized membrane protein (DUF373 family)